jgi:peptidoglycan/LPS O-acetylase OafA/YrhL
MADATRVVDRKGSTQMRDVTQDCLRGIAALTVMVAHLPGTPLSTDLGQAGVRLFFIVSGYCIFLSLNAGQGPGLRSFLLKRGFRLYPAYWLSIAVAVALAGGTVGAGTVAANVTMLQRFMGVNDIVGVYWTLFYEVIFYVLAMVLHAAGLSRSLRGLMAALAVVSVLGIVAAALRGLAGVPAPIALFIFVALFLGGGVLYHLQAAGRSDEPGVWAGVLAFCGVMLVMPWLVSQGESLGGSHWARYGGYCLTAVAAFRLGTTWLPLRSRVLAFVGSISYSLYLIHELVIAEVAARWDGVAMAAISVGLSLAAAYAMWVLVERPGVRLGQITLRRLAPRAAAASVA